jgi:hypothetical protein
MNNSLNFVFFSDKLETNGDGIYGRTGPFINYLQSRNLSYTLNGEIRHGFKNILPIEISGGWAVRDIPNDILKFVSEKDIKLLLINLPDPTTKAGHVFSLNYLKDKINFDNVIYIDTNLRLPSISTSYSHKVYWPEHSWPRVYAFSYFIEEATWNKERFYGQENCLGYVSEPIEVHELNNFRNKKFISFNRNAARAHRFILLDEFIKGTFSDSYFSFLRPMDYFEENKQFYKSYSGVELTDDDMVIYNQKMPIELDTHATTQKDSFDVGNTFKKDLFLDSCINLVTETSYIDNELFLSEKILKPILSYQPFIVFGAHGYLAELKNYGFKTFSDFWDESYDNIKSPVQRMKSLISLVKSLNNKSIEELNDIYKSTIDICIHNRNLFYSLELDTLKVIFEDIENEW